MKKCDLTKYKIEYIDLMKNSHDRVKGLDPQTALDILCDYLLGTDYYITDPVNNYQGNLIIVDDIINKYAKKELKDDIKQYEECNCRCEFTKRKGE